MSTQKFLDNLTGLPTLWNQIKTLFVAKEDGKGLSSNDFTTTLKNKLDGIEEGAEVNQNAVQTLKVGTTNVSATTTTDAITLVEGANVTITPDADNKTITIEATDTTYTAATTTADGLMSAADKAKLEEVAGSADENVIETVKVNGTALTPDGDKAVDVTVPTKVSDLTNDSKFQTDTEVASAISTAIASAYIYKGSVDSADDLPTSDQKTGDIYNIVQSSTYGPAGMNVAWNGTAWDALGSSITIDAMTAQEVTDICNLD